MRAGVVVMALWTAGVVLGCGSDSGDQATTRTGTRVRDLRCEVDADCRAGETCETGVDGGAAFAVPQCTCLCDTGFSCDPGCACDVDCRSTASSTASTTSGMRGSSSGGGGNSAGGSSSRRSSSRPVSATCGDGVLDANEECDGNCPTSCNDNNPCTVDTLRGSAAQCTATCEHEPLTACTNSDQCCPAGCNASRDNDCSASCGDGVVQTGETCDGNCPTSCNDGAACTNDRLVGALSNCTAQCLHDPITSCVGGDGCCPSQCNRNVDSDCAAVCGNGAVEPGEVCDGNCPSTCDDFFACTRDTRTGSASSCNVQCTHTNITQCTSGDGCCPSGCNRNTDSDCSAICGNGILESGETCDGNCPTSCDDGDACTVDTRNGSGCNVVCSNAPPPCRNADGCCPAGCNANNDNDCWAQCGNGVVESFETCDGNCPTSCAPDGNACTADVVSGSAQYCDAECRYTQTINTCINGDGCCPRDRCSLRQDSDCSCSLYGQYCEGSADCCPGYRCLGAPATGYRCYND